ncbi:MAG: DUF305 domain-containing protein [Nocardioides sp.]
MTAPRRLAVVATLLSGLMLLVGCAGEQPTGSTPHGDAESSSGADPAEHSGHGGHTDFSEPPAEADYNAADASYLSLMIGHHKQALDMSELARDRALDPRVRTLARSIDAGQAREIIVMATWLVDHDFPEPTLAEAEHMSATGGMAGMLNADQMAALAAASGAAFDRLYLTGMVQHHQGAVGMAEALVGVGEDVRVNDMATEVIATQNSEIRRMRALLDDLA